MKYGHQPAQKLAKRLTLALAATLCLSHSAWANPAWINNGTDWNTAGNWTAGQGVPTGQDYAVFNLAATVQPNIDASTTAAALIFKGPGTNASGYDITATNNAVLTLDGEYTPGNGLYYYIDALNTGTNTIAAPIAVDNSTLNYFGASLSGGTLVLSGTMSASSVTNTGLGSPGGSGTGEIGFNAVSGATLKLTGANTFTNNVLINGGGTVQVNTIGTTGGSASALGENSTINLAGADLNYIGAGETTNKTLSLSGAANSIDTTGATGALVISSALTATSTTALTLTGTNTGNQIAQIVNGTSATTSVTKSGSGTWALTGANSYTGNTAINAGTLVVSGSTASGSAVTLAGGATLAGGGTVGGHVSATGAAGSSTITAATTSTIGNLSLTGGVTSSTGLTLDLAIDGAGATNSTLTLGSALSVSGGALTFNLYDLGTNTLQGNTPYTLITGTGLITDTALTANLLNSAYTLKSSYGTDGILISGDTATFEIVAVPEPSTVWLLGLGVIGLGFKIRRTRFSRL